ncbi:hypothetical protein ACHHYP_11543 [Achlya hypogyna]|uniref:Uncharacterized protein n=1 Tax=Achlya hypogyna TaxID=1202772 RepID=A0A1V9YIZ7_ACHHY|nr:hypothetical protein ACHHYP_11543 [Achlya hypogyna]
MMLGQTEAERAALSHIYLPGSSRCNEKSPLVAAAGSVLNPVFTETVAREAYAVTAPTDDGKVSPEDTVAQLAEQNARLAQLLADLTKGVESRLQATDGVLQHLQKQED